MFLIKYLRKSSKSAFLSLLWKFHHPPTHFGFRESLSILLIWLQKTELPEHFLVPFQLHSQGLIPSLILFLYYTPDIPCPSPANEIQSYADDITICSSNISTTVNCSTLQSYSKRFLQWCGSNRLKINPEVPKKKVITGISWMNTPVYLSKVIFSSSCSLN